MGSKNKADACIKEFNDFAKKNPAAARKRATDILIKTGVLSKSGKKKDVISINICNMCNNIFIFLSYKFTICNFIEYPLLKNNLYRNVFLIFCINIFSYSRKFKCGKSN